MAEICPKVAVFHETFRRIYNGATLQDIVPCPSPGLLQAEAFMRLAHYGQTRKGPDQRPYAHHPLMVFFIVRQAGGSGDEQVAALLHDCVEDMQKSWPGAERQMIIDAIEDQFGDGVAFLVENLSNPEDLTLADKKQWQTQQFTDCPEIRRIKLADKLASHYDDLFDTPLDWSQEKLNDAKGAMVYLVEHFKSELNEKVLPFYRWLKAQEVGV